MHSAHFEPFALHIGCERCEKWNEMKCDKNTNLSNGFIEHKRDMALYAELSYNVKLLGNSQWCCYTDWRIAYCVLRYHLAIHTLKMVLVVIAIVDAVRSIYHRACI